jgi:hypothetical protein
MSDPVGTLAAIMDDKDAQIERLRAALEKIKETPVTNSFGWKLCRACHAVFGGEHKPDCVFVSEGISGSPSPDTVRVKEEIECAAAKHPILGVFQLPRPYRHHNIVHMMSKLAVPPHDSEQGFVTTHGRFVSREIGWKVAKEAGQLLKRAPTGNEGVLYSEDMW